MSLVADRHPVCRFPPACLIGLLIVLGGLESGAAPAQPPEPSPPAATPPEATTADPGAEQPEQPPRRRPDPQRPWLQGPQLDELLGQPLTGVQLGSCSGVICNDSDTMRQILSLSDLEPGERCTIELLDRSRGFLMNSGYFREVGFVMRPGPAGITILLELEGEVFVDRVEIEVAEWFPAIFQREIRQRLIYRPGKALNLDPEVRQNQEETIRRLYENKGFEGTEVRIDWQISNHRARVQVRIREGRGYTLRHVYVRGNRHFSTTEIAQQFAGMLNITGTSLAGATLVPALTREIREVQEAELIRLYGADGYFEATVRSRIEKDQRARVLDLYVDVEEGPRFQVQFDGNRAIPDWELLQQLTFWESRSVSLPDARRSADRIRQRFQEEGYSFAEVEPSFAAADSTRLKFQIREGPRAELASIQIDGNRAPEATDTVLKGLLGSGESSWFAPRRLLPEKLEEDRKKIETFYKDHGYLRVNVLPPRIFFDEERQLLYQPAPPPPPGQVLATTRTTAPATSASPAVPPPQPITFTTVNGRPCRVVHRPPELSKIPLFLDIPVIEGIQTRIRSFVVPGRHSRSRQQILNHFGMAEGDPFSPERLAEGANKLRQWYFEAGFPNVRVELSCRSEGASDSCQTQDVFGQVVDVMVRLDEGKQARLGELFVRGNRRALTRVILNELPMKPGDLFNRALLNEGQANLRSLGIFRAIRITEIGSQPESPRERVALVIEVEEKEDRFIDFNLTLRSQGVQQSQMALLWGVEARYRDINLLGRGLQLSLPLKLGNELTSFEPSLLWPRPFKLQLPTTWSLFVSAQNDLRSTVGVAPVDTSFTSFFNASSFADNYNRYRFGTQLSVLLDNQRGTRLTPSISIARQGERKTAEQKLCLRGVGTLATCVDFDNLIRLAVPLFHDRRDNPLHPTRGWSALLEADYALKLSIAATTSAEAQYSRLLGAVQGYVPLIERRLVWANLLRLGWTIPIRGSVSDIPTEDLFFLGGDGNLRGFVEKSVGIKDELGVPQGDLVRLLATTELRFHLAWWFWLAAFYDTGLLVEGPAALEPGDLRHALGVGVRILVLDLMPVRFDFAQVIDQRTEDQTAIFTFNLGYPF